MDIIKEMHHDPFLQRAIEYWLDSANELGYQPLFCSWLSLNGHSVKYSIKSTVIEQGKDVVSVDANGKPYAYQLKGGDIDTKRWRSEVKPEIEAMIDLVIDHPDIDKRKKHVSYLVTNGEINDAVRLEITKYNESKWKKTPLKYLTRGDLLQAFQGMANGITPKDAVSYKQLMDLIFKDGHGTPNISSAYAFLKEIFKLDEPKRAKAEVKRLIAAGMLYATMIAGQYRNTGNYHSVVQVMVILITLIFHTVDKYKLEKKYWSECYKIIWEDLLTSAEKLENEISEKGFDPSQASPIMKSVFPFRVHATTSTIFALKLSQKLQGKDSWKTILDPEISQKYSGTIFAWGESAFIPVVFLALLLEEAGQTSSTTLIEDSISKIIEKNGRNAKEIDGLLSTYYNVEAAVEIYFNLALEPLEESFKCRSHLIKSLIEILVRLDQRSFLEKNWKEISHIRFESFTLEKMEDFYLWRAKRGENLTTYPRKQQSWAGLKKEAEEKNGKSLPDTIKKYPEFLPFFLSVFAHRANPDSLGYLHSKCK